MDLETLAPCMELRASAPLLSTPELKPSELSLGWVKCSSAIQHIVSLPVCTYIHICVCIFVRCNSCVKIYVYIYVYRFMIHIYIYTHVCICGKFRPGVMQALARCNMGSGSKR